jgi:hypothetical protein
MLFYKSVVFEINIDEFYAVLSNIQKMLQSNAPEYLCYLNIFHLFVFVCVISLCLWMGNRNFPGDKGLPARKAENLTAICESIV